MLKVLHLLNYCGNGGSENYILTLAEKLKNDCEFYLAYSESGPMLKKAEALGFQLIHLPMRSPYDIPAALKLKSLCKSLGIELVHTHFLRENFISGFSKMFGCSATLINTTHMLEPKRGAVRVANKFFSRFNTHLTAVSEAVRQLLISEGIDAEKVVTVLNGVDMEFWQKSAESSGAAEYRERLGIGASDFLIVSTARFSEEKGHLFLLESILALKNRRRASDGSRKIAFVLAGDGPLLEDCKYYSEENGLTDDVFFLGHSDDVKSLLNAADIFVCHSRSEALGLSILEAMACSLPVVATDSGGPSEILGAESNAGILVEYGDTEGMAEAILRFYDDAGFLSSCALAARKIVKDRFDLTQTAEKMLQLYTN